MRHSLETIKSRADISNLFSSGARFSNRYVTLIVGKQAVDETSEGFKQHDHDGRVAFIAGKKLGNAVWRNAAKRRLRALSYDLGAPWAGHDVIFLAKSSLTGATYSKVLEACDKTIRQSCLKRGDSPNEQRGCIH